MIAQKIVLESSIHSRRLDTGREEQSSCSLGEVVGQPPFGSSQLKATLQHEPGICNRSRVQPELISKPKKPGFLPNLRVVTKNFAKTRF